MKKTETVVIFINCDGSSSVLAEFPDGESCCLTVRCDACTELQVNGRVTDSELNSIRQRIVNIKVDEPRVEAGLRRVAAMFAAAPSLGALGRTLH